jgi:hypothetical protein
VLYQLSYPGALATVATRRALTSAKLVHPRRAHPISQLVYDVDDPTLKSETDHRGSTEAVNRAAL